MYKIAFTITKIWLAGQSRKGRLPLYISRDTCMVDFFGSLRTFSIFGDIVISGVFDVG